MPDLGSVDVSSRPRRSLDTTPHKDALKAASVWFVRLTSETVTNSEREQWLAWRQADPTHEYAWQQIEKVTQKFNASGVSAELGMAALDRPACPTRRRAVQQVVSIVALGGIGWAAYEPLIGQHYSVLGKMEQDRRKIEILEFVRYCRIIGADPHEGLNVLIESLEREGQH